MSIEVAASALALQHIRCFANLNSEQRQAIASCCRGRRYPVGDVVLPATEPNTNVFFIVSGKARITHHSPNGKETEFQLVHAGESFGEISVIDGAPRAADVVAASDLTVLTMSGENFKAALRKYDCVAQSVLCNLTQTIRTLSERIVEFSTLRVNDRIHAEILRIVQSEGEDEHGVIVRSPPTHAELAARISTHREAVTREMGYLKGLGVMFCERKMWRIVDVDALRQLAAPQSSQCS